MTLTAVSQELNQEISFIDNKRRRMAELPGPKMGRTTDGPFSVALSQHMGLQLSTPLIHSPSTYHGSQEITPTQRLSISSKNVSKAGPGSRTRREL